MDADPLILKVPFDQHLETLSRIMVVAADDHGDLLEQYFSAPPAEAACKAEGAVAVLVRSARLNSPDRLVVTDVERAPGRLRVTFEITRFTGPMAANDPWFALVCLDMDRPQSGSNEILLTETTLSGADPPGDGAVPVSRHEERLRFACP